MFISKEMVQSICMHLIPSGKKLLPVIMPIHCAKGTGGAGMHLMKVVELFYLSTKLGLNI